MSKKRS